MLHSKSDMSPLQVGLGISLGNQKAHSSWSKTRIHTTRQPRSRGKLNFTLSLGHLFWSHFSWGLINAFWSGLVVRMRKSAGGAKDECQLLRKAEVFKAEHGGFGKPICKVNTLNKFQRLMRNLPHLVYLCLHEALWSAILSLKRGLLKAKEEEVKSIKIRFLERGPSSSTHVKTTCTQANLPSSRPPGNAVPFVPVFPPEASPIPSLVWMESGMPKPAPTTVSLPRTGRDIPNQGPTGLSRESSSTDELAFRETELNWAHSEMVPSDLHPLVIEVNAGDHFHGSSTF